MHAFYSSFLTHYPAETNNFPYAFFLYCDIFFFQKLSAQPAVLIWIALVASKGFKVKWDLLEPSQMKEGGGQNRGTHLHTVTRALLSGTSSEAPLTESKEMFFHLLPITKNNPKRE